MQTDTFVNVSQLYFNRGEKVIFSGVNCRFQRGKITAIMGPSGTGKTTLLRLIGAQLRPDAGSIHVDSYNVHRLKRAALYRLRKRMGVLFQAGALFTNLSVFDNVAFPLREHTDLSESLIRDVVLMKLETVGLRGASQFMPEHLSGGMARRVALARAIALDPELIMYDEPFAGQDPISKGVIIKLIKDLNTVLGLTSVIVSHDVKETASIADYIYVISEGKVLGEGSPETLYKEANPAVNQFLQGLPDGAVPFHHPAENYAEELF